MAEVTNEVLYNFETKLGDLEFTFFDGYSYWANFYETQSAYQEFLKENSITTDDLTARLGEDFFRYLGKPIQEVSEMLAEDFSVFHLKFYPYYFRVLPNDSINKKAKYLSADEITSVLNTLTEVAKTREFDFLNIEPCFLSEDDFTTVFLEAFPDIVNKYSFTDELYSQIGFFYLYYQYFRSQVFLRWRSFLSQNRNKKKVFADSVSALEAQIATLTIEKETLTTENTSLKETLKNSISYADYDTFITVAKEKLAKYEEKYNATDLYYQYSNGVLLSGLKTDLYRETEYKDKLDIDLFKRGYENVVDEKYFSVYKEEKNAEIQVYKADLEALENDTEKFEDMHYFGFINSAKTFLEPFIEMKGGMTKFIPYYLENTYKPSIEGGSLICKEFMAFIKEKTLEVYPKYYDLSQFDNEIYISALESIILSEIVSFLMENGGGNNNGENENTNAEFDISNSVISAITNYFESFKEKISLSRYDISVANIDKSLTAFSTDFLVFLKETDEFEKSLFENKLLMSIVASLIYPVLLEECIKRYDSEFLATYGINTTLTNFKIGAKVTCAVYPNEVFEVKFPFLIHTDVNSYTFCYVIFNSALNHNVCVPESYLATYKG